MERRSFIKGVLGIGCATVAPSVLAETVVRCSSKRMKCVRSVQRPVEAPRVDVRADFYKVGGKILSLELKPATIEEVFFAVNRAHIPDHIKHYTMHTLLARCGRSDRLTVHDAIKIIEQQVRYLEKTGEL